MESADHAKSETSIMENESNQGSVEGLEQAHHHQPVLSVLDHHEAKMKGIQAARGRIPVLRAAAVKEPNNTAIQAELERLEEMSDEVEYLCTGPNILASYINAKSDEEKMHLERRYFEEALKMNVPPEFFDRWEHLLGKHTMKATSTDTKTSRNNIEASTVTSTPTTVDLRAKRRRLSADEDETSRLNNLIGLTNCKYCGSQNSVQHDHTEGESTCQKCGRSIYDGLSTELEHLGYTERKERNTSQKLSPRKGKGKCGAASSAAVTTAAGKYKYECRSYLIERLAQVQAKETICISEADMRKINQGLIKYRHESVDGWTALEMKSFLGKCNLPHLYRHSWYLICWLSKTPSIAIPKEVEKLLIEAFDQMAVHVEAYKSLLSDYRTAERKSRPHYGYICRKLLELMGQDQSIIDAFPQLISSEKVSTYDSFWKMICSKMDWPVQLSKR